MMVFTQTEESFVCVCMSDYFAHLITHQNALSTEVDFSGCGFLLIVSVAA